MTAAICRIGDIVVGICEADSPGHPHEFIGTWITGSEVCTADDIGIVRVGDIGHTDCGHTFIAVEGSEISTADGIPIHRVGDVVHVLEGGVGVSTTGSETSFSD